MKFSPKKLTVRKRFLIAGGVVLVLALGVWVWSHPKTKEVSQTTKSTSDSTKGKAKGDNSVADSPGNKAPATTPKDGSTTNAKAMTAPTGQVLNTNAISLSASSGPTMPSMESTVISATPGSNISIIASQGGSEKTVATAGTADSYGQYNQPINWNAKTQGLTPGSWSVRIKTTLNGQTALSESSILLVSP